MIDRKRLAGWLLVTMGVSAVVHAVAPGLPIWTSGIAAWAAAACVWPDTSRLLRIQVLVLVACGVGALTFAFGAGDVRPAVGEVLSRNTTLLGMLVAVTFLRLITLPASGARTLPRGVGAFARTAVGVHLFGCVINISSVILMADRLTASRPMDRLTGTMFARAFSACAFWSPFIGGTAIVLAYLPEARLPVLMSIGMPVAGAAVIYTVLAGALSRHGDVRAFAGYPIRLDGLRIPFLLATGVLVVHTLLPDLPVLVAITLTAALTTLVVATYRAGPGGALAMIRDHVDRRLADMGGELTLFLAAGVLTVGVSSLALAFPGDWLPYDRLGPTEASATLAIVVAVAAAGVHPIVLVSILAPLLPPITELPNLAAAMFMMAWSIGVSASPLSGTHLILQARYGIPSWHFSRWNVAYCLVMLAVSTAALHLYAGIAG